MILEDRKIDIWAYNLETVISEKLESVITRNIFGTRLKDYFDLYILQEQKNKIDFKVLARAFINTCEYRHATYCKEGVIDFNYCETTVQLIANNPKMNRLWSDYVKSHHFAANITFDNTITAINYWLNQMGN